MHTLVNLLKEQYLNTYSEELSCVQETLVQVIKSNPIYGSAGLFSSSIRLDCIRSALIFVVNDCLDKNKINRGLMLEVSLILEIVIAGHAMHTKQIFWGVGEKNEAIMLSMAKRVLIGDYLLSYAYERLVKIGSISLVKAFSNASARTSEGEVLSLKYARASASVTDNGIITQLICLKTAPLFCLPVESHKILSGGGDKYPTFMKITHNIAELFHFLIEYDSNKNITHFENIGKRILFLLNEIRLYLDYFPGNKGKELINVLITIFESFSHLRKLTKSDING